MVKVTVNVEGMMCGHCEATCKRSYSRKHSALKTLYLLTKITQPFSQPRKKVDEDKIRQTIKDAGYEVNRNYTGIKGSYEQHTG